VPDGPEAAPRSIGVPRAVAATVALFACLAATWSVVAPLAEAPDEPAHLALVLHLADGGAYPDYDGLNSQRSVYRLCREHAAATRACPRSGEVATPTSYRRHPRAEAPLEADRPAWDDGDGADPESVVNQMPQHPPLYYQAMATVLRVERALTGDSWSLARELALLRLVNVALVTPLPWLAWCAARRMGLREPGPLTAAIAVAGVPMLTHIGSTLNNDNLLTLLGGVLVALLAGVARGDRSLRTALLVGLTCGLAALTKAFGLAFPVAAAIAYAVGARAPTSEDTATNDDTATYEDADRPRTVGAVAATAIVGALTLLVSGWWYVGNRLRHGRFTPTTEDARLTTADRPPGFDPSVVDFLGRFAGDLNRRFWGAFGWYTIRFPWWLALIATVAVAAVAVVALLPSTRTTPASVRQRATLLAPVGLLGAMVLIRAWDLHVRTGTHPFIQGRYLFAGLVGVAVLAAIGVVRLAPRRAPWVVLGFAALLQGEALRRAVPGWWGGPGVGPGGQVRALAAWSGWPDPVVFGLAALLVAAAVWLTVEVGLVTRGDRRPVRAARP